LEAEAAVLGAALVDGKAALLASQIIDHKDFLDTRHRTVFEAVEDLLNDGNPVDLVTVTDRLDREKKLVSAGGAAFVSGLLDQLPDIANVEYYAGLVAEYARNRATISAAKVLVAGLEGGVDYDSCIEEFTRATASLTSGPEPVLLKTGVLDAVDHILNAHAGEFEGTVFLPLEEILLPFQNGNVYVVGGAAGSGKTALCDQIGLAAAQAGKTTLIFALEMTTRQRAVRYLAGQTGIPVRRLTIGQLSSRECETLKGQVDLSHPTMFIDDAAGSTALDIRARARALKAKHGLGLVVVDYLQLIEPSGRGRTRQEEVAAMSSAMLRMARELEVPVIVASQLSRQHEQEKRPPSNRDLRESGRIEQDAFAVILLHRPNRGMQSEDSTIAYVGKQRDGGEGSVILDFDPIRMVFTPQGHIGDPQITAVGGTR
jgi:replicative DNA helicase